MSEIPPASGSTAIHVPVLLREVVAQLELRPGLTVVDGTVGAGGHSREILPRIRPDGRLIGLDRDPMMLGHAGRVVSGPDVQLIHSSYRDLRSVLDTLSLPAVDRVLLDLGLSSDQLADRERGFGFDAGGPLDMRFDVSRGRSAANWLNTATEAEIAAALREDGEVGPADRIASEIVNRRRQGGIHSADDLIDTLNRAVGGGRSGRGDKTLAAQVFQAIRIAVNEELDHLREFLSEGLPQCLKPGGRAAIITFHSLEDRLVKQTFKKEIWEPVSKKPIDPTPAEVRINPRISSARLRVAVRRSDDLQRN